MSLKAYELLNGVNFFGVNSNTEITGISENPKDCKNCLVILTDASLFSLAQENGAICILSDKLGECKCPLIIAENLKSVICKIYANFWGNPQKQIKIIGVTGTNGKTTTALLISHILNRFGKKCAFLGTLSKSGYTTPPPNILYKKIREFVDDGYEYLSMEVSSHALSQSRVDVINFDVGILTNISRDHLDYHLSMKEYIYAKTKLFKQSKISLINKDINSLYDVEKFGNVFYSVKSTADYTGKNILFSKNGVKYELKNKGKSYIADFAMPGIFSVYNSLAAISTANIIGIPLKDSVKHAVSFCGVSGRVEKIDNPFGLNVYIDYAHTPDGIENLILALRPICENRLIILMGCGGDRDKGKRPIMCSKAVEMADFVVLTSDNPRNENPCDILRDMLKGIGEKGADFAVIPDRKKAIEFALSITEKNDILVLAGKGHEVYQCIGNKKIPFNEKEIMSRIFSKEGMIKGDKLWRK